MIFIAQIGTLFVLLPSNRAFYWLYDQLVDINIYILGLIALISVYLMVKYHKKVYDKFSKVWSKIQKYESNKAIIIYLFLYFVIFVFIAYWKHINLGTALFDFGLQEQILWNTSHGRWLQTTPEYVALPGVSTYLADHFSPIVVITAAIYKIFPYSITLFIIQTGAIVVGLYGLYKLAQHHIKNNLISTVFTILASWFGGLSGLLLFDYHPIVLAFPLLIWGIYFFDKQKYKWGLFLLVFSLLVKEDVGIFVGCLGLFYLLYKKDKVGYFLVIIGFLSSLVSLMVVIPYFRGVPSDTLSRYGYLGDSAGAIIKTLIARPLYVFKSNFTRRKIGYLIKIFAPFMPFSLFHILLLTIVPNLLINLLSQSFYQTSMLAQYDAMTSVGVMVTAILGIKYFLNNDLLFTHSYKVKMILINLLISIIILFLGHSLWDTVSNISNRAEDRQTITEFKKTISKDQSILVSNLLGGQFGVFEEVYLLDNDWLPTPNQPTDYIIVDHGEKLDFDIQKVLQRANYVDIGRGDISIYQKQ